MVFDKSWFEKHQDRLLYLVNDPITSPMMRHLLRIDGKRSDVGNYLITAIAPNAITWGDDLTKITEFRGHNKFGKRLYYGLYPLWRACHEWDEFIAKFTMGYKGWDYALNLGFDTLTAYPDADPETATVDGHVRRSSVDQTFANIRSGAGVANSATTAQENILQLTCSTTTDQFAVMRRYFWLYDTTSVPSGANVSSVTKSVYGSAKTGNIGSPDLDIVTATPASNTALANGDYAVANFGTTVHGSVTYAGFSTSGYNDITLTTTSITKAGITKFGGRNSWDTDASFTGTWVSGDVSSMQAYSADQTGTSNDPKLVVVYSTTSIKTVNGLAVASVKTVNDLAIASVKTVMGLA